MSYQPPLPPPPPPPIPMQQPGPAGYGAPAPPARKNRTWCIVGCIAALLLGGVLLCCLMPAGFGFWAVKNAGAPAQSWLTAVSQGNMDEAGTYTVGGSEAARDLAAKVENQVGKLEASQGFQMGTEANYTNGVGRIRLPISGSKGRSTAVFEMEKHEDTWKVKDVTFDSATSALDETP
jgi:hypothetical protein